MLEYPRIRIEQEHYDQKALSFISSSHILKTSSFFLAGVDGFFLCFIIYLPLSLSLMMMISMGSRQMLQK